MLDNIVKNKVVSAVLLVVRLFLGYWFLKLVIQYGMLHPHMWVQLGSAMKYLGIGFLPGFWGFMAVLSYVVGSLLLITGVYSRWASGFMAFDMIVASHMHFALGQGLAAAKPALIFLVVFVILTITGPGIYSLGKYIKK
jgi:putative oxidoreductase